MQNVQSIINSISNVEIWANGATGLLNANSLNSLTTAISGLSKEQALLVLSTKNLSKAQTEQVLSAAGLLNVEKQLTTAQISERLANELNTKADAEALLINSGLITQKELEENATINLTAAKINEAVVNGTLSASDAGVIAGALGITGVNTGATISFDLLTASIWANIKALGTWLVTNPIGGAILAGTAIFGLVKAYDALTDSVEEVKKRTDALLETYNSAISEANSNAQTIESLASRYEKLSKGVNNLGENVSLTADEYSEYNDIVNQIADMFPTMIAGYTDEGNAILSLKGNVEGLRDAYKKAQEEAYNLLIVSGKDNDGNDIIINYQNQVHGNESWLSKQSSYIDGEAGAKDAIEIITTLTGALTPDEFRETYNQLYEEYKNIWNSDKIQDALKSSGFKALTHAPKWSEITAEDLANLKYSARVTVQTYNAEINSQLRNVQTLANAYLMTNSDYKKLDEQSKTATSLLINSISENIANDFSSKIDVGTYVDYIVQTISNNPEVNNALIELLTMDTTDMPVDLIKSTVTSYITTIAKFLKENPLELKARLGFEDVDTTAQNYNRVMQQAATKFSRESYKPYSDNPLYSAELEALNKFAEENSINTQDEIAFWNKCIDESDTREEAMKKYLKSSDTIETPISSFQDAWASLDAPEEDTLNGFKEKLLSLAEAGQLTLEAFQATEGSNSFLAMLGIEEDDTYKINNLISQINSLVSSSEQLASMKKGISGLSQNLSAREQNPGTAIESDVLSGMDGELKAQTKEWKRYETVLGDASSSIEEVQEATNDLASAYINSNNFLANLTEANKDYYISQLNAMGVTNAQEIVEERITAQRQVAEYKTQALDIATRALTMSSQNSSTYLYEQSSALLEQAQMSNLAKAELVDLIAQQTIFAADNDMGIWEKIQNIEALTNAYFDAATAKVFLNKVQVQDGGAQNSYETISPEEALRQTLKLASEIKRPKIDTPPTPKGGGNTKSEIEETKKEFSETFSWVDRLVKRLQSAFDRWLKQAETALTKGTISKYYNRAAAAAKSQMDTYSRAYSYYMAKANDVGLGADYISRIRDGDVSVEDVKHEETANKIKEYQDWYEKAQEAMESYTDAAEKLANIPLDKAAKKAELFSDSIDLIDKKLENATKLKNKNKLIAAKDKEEKKTLNAHKDAKKETAANLSSARKTLLDPTKLGTLINLEQAKNVRKAVKNKKEIDLSLFQPDSDGYRAAVQYNEALKAHKKATQEAALAQQDYNRWLVESAKQKFDNTADAYQKQLQKKEWKMSQNDRRISEIEASGRNVNISYYKSQKKINNSMLKKYRAEEEALMKKLKKIKPGTDEWYEANEQIEEVRGSISDCVKKTYELNNAANQLNFDLHNDISEGISRISAEQEFMRGLFSHEKNVDTETGKYTKAGLANLGTLSAEYYASKENAAKDKSLLEDLEQVKAKGLQKDGTYKLGRWTFNSLDDLQDKIDETYTRYQDSIKETYNLESGIADAVKERYQAELDMVRELIDAKKESLNAAKDLHNYNRTIQEKTDNIATIKKQIAAYSGDTSQEGLARLQKLQKELNDKQKDLDETEYDRYISDQQEMLDKLYGEYEELMSKKMDDFSNLVKEGLNTANENMTETNAFLKEIAEKYEYQVETKGIYNPNTGNIEQNVGTSVKTMADKKTKQSGTKKGNEALVKEVKAYIKENASTAKKAKGKYTAVNQKRECKLKCLSHQ